MSPVGSKERVLFARVIRTTVGGLLLGAAARPLCAQPYDEPFFIGIGRLEGGSTSIAQDCSADGLVASADTFLPSRLLRWTKRDGLDLIAGNSNADTQGGISGLGDVIVGGFVGGGTRWALRWTPGTGAVSLGDLDGGIFRSMAKGVSARGDIIVGYGASERSDGEAFRWTAETGLVGLGGLPDERLVSAATAVSADGRVIVGGGPSGLGNQAIRWTAETGMIGLGDLPGGVADNSGAAAVSADGSVIVGSGYDADGQRGFRWTEATGMVALPKVTPDDSYNRFHGVSWDGNFAVGTNGRAICWTPEGGTRLLVDVLAEHGVIVPDTWSVEYAGGVSADGRTIVGSGVNFEPGPHTEGFVAYLGPACRADYDQSGAVDAGDVWAYLAAWSAQTIFADWNYDGWLDARDILAFFNEWVDKPGC